MAWNPKRAQCYGHSWTKLRAAILRRDRYICQCPECKATGRVRLASEVDHIIPVANGGTDDLANLQAIHAECHKKKTILDKGLNPRPLFGIDCWPIYTEQAGPDVVLPKDLRASRPALTILCGPPGSGKSTYVNGQRGPDDVVIDYAEIKAELSQSRLYEAGDQWIKPALLERNRRLAALAASDAHRAWFLTGAPTAVERTHWQRMLGGSVMLFAVPMEECLRRIAKDPRRAALGHQWHKYVARWWAQYTPAVVDKGRQHMMPA